MICVPELSQGTDAYRRIGFDIHPGGVHTGRGTHNAIAFNEDDYLELMSVRDRDEYVAKNPNGGLLEFLARGGNSSMIHVDFMIGSDNMDIDGITDDGRAEPILRKGEWAFNV